VSPTRAVELPCWRLPRSRKVATVSAVRTKAVNLGALGLPLLLCIVIGRIQGVPRHHHRNGHEQSASHLVSRAWRRLAFSSQNPPFRSQSTAIPWRRAVKRPDCPGMGAAYAHPDPVAAERALRPTGLPRLGRFRRRSRGIRGAASRTRPTSLPRAFQLPRVCGSV
jgi:hypothetical protein